MRTLTRLLFLALAGWWTATAVAADGPEELRRAAEAGDVEAQLQLGTLYEYGFHMPDNEAPALAWYTLAAEQGDAKAAARRDALRARMQPATVEQAAVLAGQWRTARRQPPPTPAAETAAETLQDAPITTATPAASDGPISAANRESVLANLPAERVGSSTAGLAAPTGTAEGASP